MRSLRGNGCDRGDGERVDPAGKSNGRLTIRIHGLDPLRLILPYSSSHHERHSLYRFPARRRRPLGRSSATTYTPVSRGMTSIDHTLGPGGHDGDSLDDCVAVPRPGGRAARGRRSRIAVAVCALATRPARGPQLLPDRRLAPGSGPGRAVQAGGHQRLRRALEGADGRPARGPQGGGHAGHLPSKSGRPGSSRRSDDCRMDAWGRARQRPGGPRPAERTPTVRTAHRPGPDRRRLRAHPRRRPDAAGDAEPRPGRGQ